MRLACPNTVMSALVALGLLAACSTPPPETPKTTATLKPDMQRVFFAFRDLQKYTANEETFSDPTNAAAIKGDLNTLIERFHDVGTLRSALTSDPGFESTLKILNDMLHDARARFATGNTSYSLWKIKTISTYCISCHTRYEIPFDFQGADVLDESATAAERGDFYLATRQFDKASTAFMQAAREASSEFARIEALRKWLIIYSRVHPDPRSALTELTKLTGEIELGDYESEEIKEWLGSMRRWQNEGLKKKIDPLVQAEALIRQAVGVSDTLSLRAQTVELLRATAILHRVLDSRERTEGRSHSLYLLGYAYSKLPSFFVTELPELFFEQCIREFPGTADAKKSYRLFEEVVTLGYTGSGGTRLPSDVSKKFKELHDMAYAVQVMKDRL